MADVDDAVAAITDPSNVTRMGQVGPQGDRFAVNANRVIKSLREAGAGKAEARELALEALEKVGGGAEIHSTRAAQRGPRGDRRAEDWWIPADKVRF